MALRKNKDENNYWISYSDLMTGFLIVFIILTFAVYKNYKHKAKEIEVLLNEYKKIEEIKSALNNLNSKYFVFDTANKRHELSIKVLFPPGKYNIPAKYRKECINAGKELKRVIDNVSNADSNIRYLVIIEGMAAKYNNPKEKWKNSDPKYKERTYVLSYKRAKALYELWDDNKMKFKSNNVEIILAGSGWFGAGRYHGKEEDKNKRFLIQIIPKIGEIKNNSFK